MTEKRTFYELLEAYRKTAIEQSKQTGTSMNDRGAALCGIDILDDLAYDIRAAAVAEATEGGPMRSTTVEIPSGEYCTRDIEGKGCPWFYRNNDNDDTCGCPKIGQRLEEDDEGVLHSERCRETYPCGAVVTITAKTA